MFFTHRDVRMKVDVRSIAADESEFGVTIKTSRTKRSRARSNLFGMPNVALLGSRPRQKRDVLAGVPSRIARSMTNTTRLQRHSHSSDGKKRIVSPRRARKFAHTRISTTEMAARIVAGNATIDDFTTRAPNIVGLEDEVVLAAQGAIPDRENETLGRSDMGVLLLRQIWLRELAAPAEGGQLKKWTRPAALLATTGFSKL